MTLNDYKLSPTLFFSLNDHPSSMCANPAMTRYEANSHAVVEPPVYLSATMSQAGASFYMNMEGYFQANPTCACHSRTATFVEILEILLFEISPF